MSHFTKPHLFDETQRQAVLKILDQLGTGDEEGQRIFVYALEHELAQYEDQQARELRVPEPEPEPRRGGVFSELHSACDDLRTLLHKLSTEYVRQLGDALTKDDPFAREYTAGYFSALESELERLVAACSRLEVQPQVAPPTQSAKRRFVSMVAKAYYDCFEEAPSAATDGPFVALLKALAKELDIDASMSSDELRDLFYKTDWSELTLTP